MKFGLTKKEIDLIKSVFKEREEIERVFIYGSRAKGNYRKNSDIDLVVRFKKNKKGDIKKIKFELDDLPLIYNIDVACESEITPGSFMEQFQKNKKIFY